MRDTAEARRLPVEGARNLRDLGGYRTADGRIVQPRKILRGGHPGQMTQAGRAAFARLGLRTIVDLRSTSERETLPFPDDVLASARYWSRGYDLSRGDIVQILRDPATSPDLMRQRMISNYAILPYEQGPGIAAALRLLAEGEVPLLVNCTAGKDRTGIACAVILAALGVPREQVVEDYALSEWLEDPASQLFEIDPEGPFAFLLSVDPAVWHVMNRSDPDYIRASFAALDEAHGSVEGYLEAELEIGAGELERLREVVLAG